MNENQLNPLTSSDIVILILMAVLRQKKVRTPGEKSKRKKRKKEK